MNCLTPVRTVEPFEPPLSLTEVKEHLRVTHDFEDSLIAAILDAAVGTLDGWSGILGRCLVTQTWRQDRAAFCDTIRLPFPDVASVTVAYTDTAAAPQTVASSGYHLSADALGSFLTLADGASWPSVAVRPDAVRITMVCGYGGAEAVPDALKMAIKLHCATLYANRETLGSGMTSNMTYEALIAPHRRMTV